MQVVYFLTQQTNNLSYSSCACLKTCITECLSGQWFSAVMTVMTDAHLFYVCVLFVIVTQFSFICSGTFFIFLFYTVTPLS